VKTYMCLTTLVMLSFHMKFYINIVLGMDI